MDGGMDDLAPVREPRGVGRADRPGGVVREGKVNYDPAIAQVQQWILEAWSEKPNSPQVDIYIWPDVETYGLRVAELSLSFTASNGFPAGASFMQSDPEHAKVLFLIERAILDIAHYDEEADLEFVKAEIIAGVWGDEDDKAQGAGTA